MAVRSRRAAESALRDVSSQLDEAADALRRVSGELSTSEEDGAAALSAQVTEALTSASAAHMTLSALIDARRRADADKVASTLGAAQRLVEHLRMLERAAWKLAELPRKVGLMSAKLAGVLALCRNLATTRAKEGFNVDAALDQLDRLAADVSAEEMHRRTGSWTSAVVMLDASLAETAQIQGALQKLPSHQVADAELRKQVEELASQVSDVAASSIGARDDLARDFSGDSVDHVADIILAASNGYTSALVHLDDASSAAILSAAMRILADARDSLLGVVELAATIRDVHERNLSALEGVDARLTALCASAAVNPTQAATLGAEFDEVSATTSSHPDPLVVRERLARLDADIDEACEEAQESTDPETAESAEVDSGSEDNAEPAYSPEALEELAELADLAEHIR